VKVHDRKKTLGERTPDIFDPEEERRSEEEPEEEPEEEQEKEEDSSCSEEEGEVEDDESDYDPWNPLRANVGEDLKEPFMKEVQRFLDRGKTQDYAENAAFNTLLPASRRTIRRTY